MGGIVVARGPGSSGLIACRNAGGCAVWEGLVGVTEAIGGGGSQIRNGCDAAAASGFIIVFWKGAGLAALDGTAFGLNITSAAARASVIVAEAAPSLM